VLTVGATRTCSHDVWNIDMEHVRTRFLGGLKFHENFPRGNTKKSLSGVEAGQNDAFLTSTWHYFTPNSSKSSTVRTSFGPNDTQAVDHAHFVAGLRGWLRGRVDC
jgi:hypothetical protein